MKLLAALLLSAVLALAADITGTWTAVVELGGTSYPGVKLDLKQTGDNLTGTYHGQLGDAPLKGTVKGDKVEFSIVTDAATAKYSGTLEGAAKMSGPVDYGGVGAGTFTATKN
jgi:hypothetical protein